METMRDATETFVASLDWVGETEEPMITALRHMAASLDKRFSASMFAQYALAYRHLLKRAPNGDEIDPLEALLNE